MKGAQGVRNVLQHRVSEYQHNSRHSGAFTNLKISSLSPSYYDSIAIFFCTNRAVDACTGCTSSSRIVATLLGHPVGVYGIASAESRNYRHGRRVPMVSSVHRRHGLISGCGYRWSGAISSLAPKSQALIWRPLELPYCYLDVSAVWLAGLSLQVHGVRYEDEQLSGLCSTCIVAQVHEVAQADRCPGLGDSPCTRCASLGRVRQIGKRRVASWPKKAIRVEVKLRIGN